MKTLQDTCGEGPHFDLTLSSEHCNLATISKLHSTDGEVEVQRGSRACLLLSGNPQMKPSLFLYASWLSEDRERDPEGLCPHQQGCGDTPRTSAHTSPAEVWHHILMVSVGQGLETGGASLRSHREPPPHPSDGHAPLLRVLKAQQPGGHQREKVRHECDLGFSAFPVSSRWEHPCPPALLAPLLQSPTPAPYHRSEQALLHLLISGQTKS